MNRELTNSFPERSDGKMARRSLLGMTVAGPLVAGTAAPQARDTSATSPAPRRRFDGKIVLITGATSGIGRSAAMQFAAEGGKVSFCGRREKLGQQVENEIRSLGGEATYVQADVRKESEVRAFVDKTVQKYGALNVAFNNAGIKIEKPLHEYSSEEWNDVVNTNLRGVIFALKYEIPHMLASGGGNVVVTSSSNAIGTAEKHSAYAASKRGLVGLVQAAAQDYAAKGIRLNALIPGTTDTEPARKAAGMEHGPGRDLGGACQAVGKVPRARPRENGQSRGDRRIRAHPGFRRPPLPDRRKNGD